MKSVSISFDVEPDLYTGKYESIKHIPQLSKLLEKYNVKATFYITCDCIEKFPRIFKQLKKEGHEIALHGYRHDRFDLLSIKEKELAIQKSTRCFKKHLGIVPKGYRAPQHSIDKEGIRILKKYKFNYDSSITPWNLYHILFFWKIKIKFLHHFASMKIHKEQKLSEVPLSSFIFPLASVTLRILPKILLRLYFKCISLLENPIFLMHSWDLIEIPSSKIYRLCKKDKYLEKFEFMLDYFSKRTKFKKISSLI